MRAFVNTEVTKNRLLDSLRVHYAADHIRQGLYWHRSEGAQPRGYEGFGCAVGCSIHDFRPGEEQRHELYPELFGIPVELAHLEDFIFESLPKKDARDWPIRFVEAVPVGADLSRVGPSYLYRLVQDTRDVLRAFHQDHEDSGEWEQVDDVLWKVQLILGERRQGYNPPEPDILQERTDNLLHDTKYGTAFDFALRAAQAALDEGGEYALNSATNYAREAEIALREGGPYPLDPDDWTRSAADMLLHEIAKAPVDVKITEPTQENEIMENDPTGPLTWHQLRDYIDEVLDGKDAEIETVNLRGEDTLNDLVVAVKHFPTGELPTISAE